MMSVLSGSCWSADPTRTGVAGVDAGDAVDERPHIDAAALRSLASQVGGDAHVHERFVGDFVVLWSAHRQRLEQALAEAHVDDADVVLLSIRSSGHMVGATRLVECALLIHGALKRQDLAACAGYLPQLDVLGAAACRELRVLVTRP